MPLGREYFNSGLYFIGDGAGHDMFFNGHWYFRPAIDMEKNGAGRQYVVKDEAETIARFTADLARDVPKLQAEIARLEGFLARVLSKAGAVEAAALAKAAAAPGAQAELF